MKPTACRVRTRIPGAENETTGTIGIEQPDGGAEFVVKTTRPELEVAAILTRDDVFAFLLAAADALGLILTDPREMARRRAASMKRRG
jgi:hypothetical protein